jgi:hypothetical protein
VADVVSNKATHAPKHALSRLPDRNRVKDGKGVEQITGAGEADRQKRHVQLARDSIAGSSGPVDGRDPQRPRDEYLPQASSEFQQALLRTAHAQRQQART